MWYIWNMWLNQTIYSVCILSLLKTLNVAAFWLKPANLSCMIQSCISVNAGSGIVLQRELTNESRRNQSLVPRVQFWSTRWEFLAFAGLQVMPCMAVVSILQMLPANAISTHASSMSVWVPKGRLPLVPMLIDGIQGPFLGQSVMAVPWQTLHFCLFPLCLHHHLFHRDHYQHGPLCHLPGDLGCI